MLVSSLNKKINLRIKQGYIKEQQMAITVETIKEQKNRYSDKLLINFLNRVQSMKIHNQAPESLVDRLRLCKLL